jgi:hypothetical protein
VTSDQAGRAEPFIFTGLLIRCVRRKGAANFAGRTPAVCIRWPADSLRPPQGGGELRGQDTSRLYSVAC